MEGFDFPVEVVRTNRKRSALICLEGEVIKVRVPKLLSERRIRELINKRAPWITTKLKEVSEQPIIKPKEYVSGEAFSYLGKNYRLKIIIGDEPSIKLKEGYFYAVVLKTDKTPQKTIRPMLISWYQQHAKMRLGEKTDRLAKIIGVRPNTIKVKDYKSRWGACSSSGDISYNWRIIFAPHHIIDYVVVHELCHILEHNHSKQYWQHVGRYVPDWKACRNWLRIESSSLII